MTDSFNGVLEIIKTLSAIVPFLLLGLLSSKVNLKREIRDRQFLMPVFTVVFVILTMIFLKNINDGILGLISGIPKLLDNIIKRGYNRIGYFCSVNSANRALFMPMLRSHKRPHHHYNNRKERRRACVFVVQAYFYL